MRIGTVKIWNRTGGWGFVTGDDGEDYFLNINNIRSGEKGPAAENVTKI